MTFSMCQLPPEGCSSSSSKRGLSNHHPMFRIFVSTLALIFTVILTCFIVRSVLGAAPHSNDHHRHLDQYHHHTDTSPRLELHDHSGSNFMNEWYMIHHHSMKFHVFSISSLDGSSSLLQSEHKNPQATFQNNNNSSSSNSTNNTTSNFSYGLYQEIIVYSNIPFFAIFCGMLVVSVASFAIQYKTVRRNQKILFGLLFALLCFVIVNMLTRIGSELTVLIPDLDTAIKTNQYVKAVDRVVVILVLYVEMLILSHICKIL